MALAKPTTIDKAISDKFETTGLKTKFELPQIDKEDKKNVITIKFPKPYENVLKKHFEEKGIPLSTGIRMILIDYMKQNELK